MNLRNKYSRITGSFILMELILYGTFLYIDITGLHLYTTSNTLKFLGITLCFLYAALLYSLSFYKGTLKFDHTILLFALLFTLISDLLILLLDYYSVGVFTFCIVQLLYLVRIHYWRRLSNTYRSYFFYIIRNIVAAIFVTILLLIIIGQIESLLILSIVYFISIFFNVRDSVIIANQYRKSKQIIFAMGMVLFILCDLNVGIFNMSGYILTNSSWYQNLYQFAGVAMWLFYLPAQVCIAISGFAENIRHM